MAKKKSMKMKEKKGKVGAGKAKKIAKAKRKEEEKKTIKTSIQINSDTRDRLYKLKFRRSYDMFLKELCDMYEKEYGN